MPRYAPFAIAFCVGLLVAPVTSAIYGGTDAPEGSYPWVAHLYVGDVSDPRNTLCGGSLIAPRLVLTAGHCLPTVVDHKRDSVTTASEDELSDYRVLLGRTDLGGSGGEIHKVVAFHTRYEWGVETVPNGALRHTADDIAVLELDSPSSIQPVRLATQADAPLYAGGSVARVIGWGTMPGATLPSHLQQVDVPVWSDAWCSDVVARPQYAVVMYDPPHEICAGNAGHDSCAGDSGGPLFVFDANGAPLEIGTVDYGAFTPDCGDATYPGVYEEVASFRDWIDPYLAGEGLGTNECWTQTVGC